MEATTRTCSMAPLRSRVSILVRRPTFRVARALLLGTSRPITGIITTTVINMACIPLARFSLGPFVARALTQLRFSSAMIQESIAVIIAITMDPIFVFAMARIQTTVIAIRSFSNGAIWRASTTTLTRRSSSSNSMHVMDRAPRVWQATVDLTVVSTLASAMAISGRLQARVQSKM